MSYWWNLDIIIIHHHSYHQMLLTELNRKAKKDRTEHVGNIPLADVNTAPLILVLAPTRELVLQIAAEVCMYICSIYCWNATGFGYTLVLYEVCI